MERDSDRQKQMEGHCSTGQGSQRAVVPMEEEEDHCFIIKHSSLYFHKPSHGFSFRMHCSKQVTQHSRAEYQSDCANVGNFSVSGSTGLFALSLDAIMTPIGPSVSLHHR